MPSGLVPFQVWSLSCGLHHLQWSYGGRLSLWRFPEHGYYIHPWPPPYVCPGIMTFPWLSFSNTLHPSNISSPPVMDRTRYTLSACGDDLKGSRSDLLGCCLRFIRWWDKGSIGSKTISRLFSSAPLTSAPKRGQATLPCPHVHPHCSATYFSRDQVSSCLDTVCLMLLSELAALMELEGKVLASSAILAVTGEPGIAWSCGSLLFPQLVIMPGLLSSASSMQIRSQMKSNCSCSMISVHIAVFPSDCCSVGSSSESSLSAAVK